MTPPDEAAERILRGTIPPLFRSIIAVSAGVFIGGIATLGVEALAHVIVPPPRGLDVTNPESVKAVMATMPAAHFLPILLGYLIGPTIGAALAARMSPSRPLVHAGIVGAFFMVGAVNNFNAIPHPLWFMVLAVVAFVAAPFLGTRLVGR